MNVALVFPVVASGFLLSSERAIRYVQPDLVNATFYRRYNECNQVILDALAYIASALYTIASRTVVETLTPLRW